MTGVGVGLLSLPQLSNHDYMNHTFEQSLLYVRMWNFFLTMILVCERKTNYLDHLLHRSFAEFEVKMDESFLDPIMHLYKISLGS